MWLNLKCVASNDTAELTKTTVSTYKSTDGSGLQQTMKNNLTSSAVISRKRKAILLPDDFHSKYSVRKLAEGMLKYSFN